MTGLAENFVLKVMFLVQVACLMTVLFVTSGAEAFKLQLVSFLKLVNLFELIPDWVLQVDGWFGCMYWQVRSRQMQIGLESDRAEIPRSFIHTNQRH